MRITRYTGKVHFVQRMALKAKLNLTRHEQMMWDALKACTAPHWVFDKQRSMQGYIFDFYADQLKIAVEIDGSSHRSSNGIADDMLKDDFAKARNILIFRVTNEEIEASPIDVLVRLAAFIASREDKTSMTFQRHAGRFARGVAKMQAEAALAA